MTYLKVNDALYPATFSGKLVDRDWENRDSKTIRTSAMDYATAASIFVNGTTWDIVQETQVSDPRVDEEGNVVLDENNEPIVDVRTETETFDNSAYCVAGAITVHPNGQIDIKMGRKLPIELKDEQLAESEAALEEAYTILYGEV